ncbi:MAG: hypothetical protein HPZ91_00025 [Lentisphaeria bacterium]|nr:hypothetical protein [Lentisphaeria bacterium]
MAGQRQKLLELISAGNEVLAGTKNKFYFAAQVKFGAEYFQHIDPDIHTVLQPLRSHIITERISIEKAVKVIAYMLDKVRDNDASEPVHFPPPATYLKIFDSLSEDLKNRMLQEDIKCVKIKKTAKIWTKEG